LALFKFCVNVILLFSKLAQGVKGVDITKLQILTTCKLYFLKIQFSYLVVLVVYQYLLKIEEIEVFSNKFKKISNFLNCIAWAFPEMPGFSSNA